MLVGTVRDLWQYPVKSMLGRPLRTARITERGIDGDRRLALVDLATGKVASAKNPRLWQQLPTLTAAWGADGEVRLARASDGSEIKPDELSELLGRPVVLTAEPPPDATLDRAGPEQVLAEGLDAEVATEVSRVGAGSPPGTFFDFAPLHLLTTATLDRIAELHPGGGPVHAARYRPNLVIRAPGAGFVENAWVGGELTIGQDLRLRIVAATPRCAVPTLAHGPLARDPEALRVPARHNRVVPLPGMAEHPCAGVYAQVVTPGRVTAGDEVRFSPAG